MFEEMFLNELKKDFFKAFDKHAKQQQVTTEQLQVKLQLGKAEGEITYEIYRDWKTKIQSTDFKGVMCIRLDIFNKEAMLTPVLHSLMNIHMAYHTEITKAMERREELEKDRVYDINQCSCFLFLRGKEICVALHDGYDFFKITTLLDLLQTKLEFET